MLSDGVKLRELAVDLYLASLKGSFWWTPDVVWSAFGFWLGEPSSPENYQFYTLEVIIPNAPIHLHSCIHSCNTMMRGVNLIKFPVNLTFQLQCDSISFHRPLTRGMRYLEIIFAKMVDKRIFPNNALSESEYRDLFPFSVESGLSSCNQSSLDKLSVAIMGAHARVA